MAHITHGPRSPCAVIGCGEIWNASVASEMGKSAKGLLGIVSSFLRGHVRAFSCLGHDCATKGWQGLRRDHGAVRGWAGRRWQNQELGRMRGLRDARPPSHLLTQPLPIQSFNEYLLSTYCVASPVMGPGDAAGDRANIISVLHSGVRDRLQSNKHLGKCKNMAIMRAAKRDLWR